MTTMAQITSAAIPNLTGEPFLQTPLALPWFAVRVSEKTRKFTESLLASQEIEYFSPMTKDVRQWSDRRKVIAVPLFSGYLFCRFDPQSPLVILRTQGVIDIIRVGNRFAEVDPNELAAVQRVVTVEAPLESHASLLCGQRVRVIDGPLTGVEGDLVEYRSRMRLVLAVTMMNRAVSIEIGRHQVTPAV